MTAWQNNQWSFLDKYQSGTNCMTREEAQLIIECNSNIIKNLKRQKKKGVTRYSDAIHMLEAFNNYYRIRLVCLESGKV